MSSTRNYRIACFVDHVPLSGSHEVIFDLGHVPSVMHQVLDKVFPQSERSNSVLVISIKEDEWKESMADRLLAQAEAALRSGKTPRRTEHGKKSGRRKLSIPMPALT